MDAARLIRTARRRNGLTQAELAARLGTHQPVISAYENGSREPSIETLRRIVDGTGSRLRVDLDRPGSSTVGTNERSGELQTPQQHADALVDVLLLADAIPTTARTKLAFPGIAST